MVSREVLLSNHLLPCSLFSNPFLAYPLFVYPLELPRVLSYPLISLHLFSSRLFELIWLSLLLLVWLEFLSRVDTVEITPIIIEKGDVMVSIEVLTQITSCFRGTVYVRLSIVLLFTALLAVGRCFAVANITTVLEITDFMTSLSFTASSNHMSS